FYQLMDEAAEAPIDDADIRIRVGDAAGNLNLTDICRAYYGAAVFIDPSKEPVVGEHGEVAYPMKGELIPTGDLAPNLAPRSPMGGPDAAAMGE
ncbi:MAG: hypothetical protein KDA85_06635, partial [Planctomycetaceae bacterium]|nr:hypothetical protein [Planctomycetaceae bacterium]